MWKYHADLSDLVPFHSVQDMFEISVFLSWDKRKIMQFYSSYWINYLKLACCLENSVDHDQLASEEAS